MQSELEKVVSAMAQTSVCEVSQGELESEPPVVGGTSALYLFWHRAMDITFGLVGGFFLLLMLPILALLIYLDSPGPIFYTQERIGYQRRKFQMYKIRSMRIDAERAGIPGWTIQGDPRVTRVGRFLRATHLDELPQAFNILLGQMSLVGPRPERAVYITGLEKANPRYRYRLLVKPGLTGWAQVEYGYGSTSHDGLIKLQYDLYYIEHQSIAIDIKIILKTILEVVSFRGK